MASGSIGIGVVAAHAGVSITTVSHTLSGRRPVAAGTRARVMASIEELGYRPNRLARSFATQRTQTAALVIPDIVNPFYPVLARSVQDVLRRDGYQTIICNTDGSRAEERSFLADAVDRRVDGIIFVPLAARAADLQVVVDAGIPLVLSTAEADGPGVARRFPTTDLVHSDDQRGTAEATGYLLEHGHRRIGFINGVSESGPAPRRLAGFRQALTEARIPSDPDLVVTTSFTREGGVTGARHLLDLAEPPTAVVCANDLIAIGVLDVARGDDLAVPGRLAVVGYDDIEAASLVSPRLTTVVNPATELGHACARLLLDRMTGQYDSVAREVVVANRLVTRESA